MFYILQSRLQKRGSVFSDSDCASPDFKNYYLDGRIVTAPFYVGSLNGIHIGKTIEAKGIEITLVAAYKDAVIHAMLQLEDLTDNRLTNLGSRLVGQLLHRQFSLMMA